MNICAHQQKSTKQRGEVSLIRLSVGITCAFVWMVLLSACHTREDNLPIQQCIQNLRRIEGAKMFWALQNHKTDGDLPTDTDLFGPDKEVKEKPKCPKGGIYTVGKVGQKPTCSEAGHFIDREF